LSRIWSHADKEPALRKEGARRQVLTFSGRQADISSEAALCGAMLFGVDGFNFAP
jgi:hypothetical protein